MNSPCGRAKTVDSSMATMESLVYLHNSFVNGLLYTERYLDQYPPAKTPCIDATYFQRSPNKQLKNQCLNSHGHTLRRTFFFCPRSPCFPSFVAPQEHTPQCQQKLLLPKKPLHSARFNQSLYNDLDSTNRPESKNTGCCF